MLVSGRVFGDRQKKTTADAKKEKQSQGYQFLDVLFTKIASSFLPECISCYFSLDDTLGIQSPSENGTGT